ncbi:MAG: hypothetical protein M3R53_08585 [Candidatus Eremiobacteraeota bacterium]|nr:hypothetical protein [Candidatus Eremiobacteraeota bacterium]
MAFRRVALLWIAAIAFATALRASADDPPCRSDFVVPYAEQCKFSYAQLHRDASPRSLAAAFKACDRAQREALGCLKSPVRQTHVVALAALYQDVSRQASIAMFAQQYRVAEALLRERLDVLGIVAREAPPGDPAPGIERKAIQGDVADALAGQCTERALAAAASQYSLAKTHKYGELAALLRRKSNDYTACAKMPTTAAKKAYVEYLALVALEESGRASQAAGSKDDANRAYRDCITGGNGVAGAAVGRVKGYLATVTALCAGRKNGKYRIDQPQPIDASGTNAFAPLTLPKS